MYRNDNATQDRYMIINGKRIPVSGGVSGRTLAQAFGEQSERRIVKHGKGLSVEPINPNRHYSEQELFDRDGRPIKIKSIPDRRKGGVFDGQRSSLSKRVVTEQVYDLALNFAKKGGVDFDEDDANWVIFPSFFMPDAWGVRTAPLMILFPTDYPRIPPIGFYLPSDLVSPHGHFFNAAYHDASSAPLLQDWNWYCCFLPPGSWQPAPLRMSGDWRNGDNLWTYVTLVNEVLCGNER